MTQSAPALAVQSVSKSFGGTHALREVSLEIGAGEIHALLGHNGSGKSTLIKILSGYHRPDSGKVSIHGKVVSYPTTAMDLRGRGVSFMHQDIGLVPSLSVLENLRLMHFSTGWLRRIKWRHERCIVADLLRSFGLDLDPLMPCARLSGSERAIVGALRAFQDVGQGPAGLVVLDEPTASLPAGEVHDLFAAIRRMAARGIGVLFVTHHLDEPLAFADRVSVLRDGMLQGTCDARGLTEADLARMILGRDLSSPPATRIAHSDGPAVLEVRDLRGDAVTGVSFSVRSGEIMALTGLNGAGHEELPYMLYGALPSRGGSVQVDGQHYVKRSPHRSRRRGIALVPGDRVRAGGCLPASVCENLSIPQLKQLSGPLGLINRSREVAVAQALLERFAILPADPELPFSALSGGNQQKALVGRWLAVNSKLLLLHEPTAGVDIGSVDQISRMLREYADAGGAVVIASSQYEDLAKLCDRVLIMRDGVLSASLSGAEVSTEAILARCYTRPVAGARAEMRKHTADTKEPSSGAASSAKG